MESDSSTAAKRFQMALDLFALGESMLRQKLIRTRPGASEAEIDQLVREWIERRPGAEHGDAEGRLVPWPRPR